MLYQMMYSSQPHTPPTLTELETLLAQARVNNAAQDITGALFLVDGVFVQILEGDKEMVTDVAARIARDPRHHGVTVFHQQPITERAFTNWSMAWLSPSAQDVAAWSDHAGAAGIDEVLAGLGKNPNRLPLLVRNVLEAIQSG